MVRLVVFDLWDTLFWKDRLSELRKRYGITGKIGRLIMTRPLSSKQAAQRLAEAYGLKTSAEQLARELKESAQKAEPVPGALEALEALKKTGVKTGLCSNTFQTAFQELGKKWGLRKRLDCVFLSYEQGILKPDPNALLYCPRRLGISPEESVMVGDKPHLDVEPARKAGMRGILFDPWNKKPGEKDRITNITEVLQLTGE